MFRRSNCSGEVCVWGEGAVEKKVWDPTKWRSLTCILVEYLIEFLNWREMSRGVVSEQEGVACAWLEREGG